MSRVASSLPESLQIQVVDAIRQIRSEIRWRPYKDKAHLAKRIEQGHLPPETSLAEYYAIIKPDTYFNSPKYHWIGSVQEIVT